MFAGAVLGAAPATTSNETVEVAIRVSAPTTAWAIALPLHGGDAWTSEPIPTGQTVRVKLPGEVPVLLCAGAAEHATQCRRVVPEGGANVGFTLTAGRHVTGRVLLGREPATHAAVQVVPVLEARRPLAVPLRRTNNRFVTNVDADRHGRFTIDHLAPGEYRLEIRLRGGYVHRTAVIGIPEPDAKPPDEIVQLDDIRIPPGVALTVEVRTTDGTPIPKAGVSVLQEADEPRVIEAHADDDGVATLSGIDSSMPIALTCVARGFARTTARLTSAPRIHTCTLERLASITGRIHDESRNVLTTAVASLDGRTAHADATGSFRLADVTPGAHRLRVTAPHHRAWIEDVTIAPGQELDLGTLTLGPGVAVRGRVIDAQTATPIAGATVAITTPAGGAAATTDDEGIFSITVEPGGRLAVNAAGYARQMFAATAETIEIRLLRPGTLEVTAWDERTGDLCVACSVLAIHEDGTLSGTTDSEGTVRFLSLSPGDYQVTREEIRTGATTVRVSGGGSMRIASVRSGGVTRVQLGTPGRMLRVTLLPSPDGWQLSAQSGTRIVTTTANVHGEYLLRKRDGERVVLALVRPDTEVRVGTIASDYAGTTATFTLASCTLRGRILRGETPAAGVPVTLLGLDGQVIARTRTLPDGTVVLPYLPPASYELRAGAHVQPVRLTASGVTDFGTLRLPPG